MKKVIGVYLTEEILTRIDSCVLNTKYKISRNQLMNELIEYGLFCYEQDAAVRETIDEEINERVRKRGIESEVNYFNKLVMNAME